MACSLFLYLRRIFKIDLAIFNHNSDSCKTLTDCYTNMLDALHDQDEAYCIEDAAVGSSAVTVFLKALEQFCGHVINVRQHNDLVTYDKRNLYEVIIHDEDEEAKTLKAGEVSVEPPTIVIDAGQEAGTESVSFALFIIEQLVACDENRDMIQNARWVIMPSTNPDGMEYSRYEENNWIKNLKVDDNLVSIGVAISWNFDEQWSACGTNNNGFSPVYPGQASGSETETNFIKRVLNKYKDHTKIYLSIKRDGHYIGYPYAHGSKAPVKVENLQFVAAEVAAKVNMRSGGVNIFHNDSIYHLQRNKPHCGHSVDFAYSLNIPLAFEMRVFLETDNSIMSKFQIMPRGYETSLRNGYISGIRELYSVITNRKKYGHVLH